MGNGNGRTANSGGRWGRRHMGRPKWAQQLFQSSSEWVHSTRIRTAQFRWNDECATLRQFKRQPPVEITFRRLRTPLQCNDLFIRFFDRFGRFRKFDIHGLGHRPLKWAHQNANILSRAHRSDDSKSIFGLPYVWVPSIIDVSDGQRPCESGSNIFQLRSDSSLEKPKMIFTTHSRASLQSAQFQHLITAY